jgi:hypothetical protein
MANEQGNVLYQSHNSPGAPVLLNLADALSINNKKRHGLAAQSFRGKM